MRVSRFKQPYFFNTDPAESAGGADPAPAEPSEEPKGNWPDNWRELYAGDDENKLGRLSRYQSPVAALDAMISAQNKISSGEYKSAEPFPAEGTDEEKQAWRESNGIPLKAEDYGIEAGDTDKEIADAIQAFAFENNMAPDHAKAVYTFLTQQEQEDIEAEKQADDQLKQRTEDELHAEWGNEYRRNLNMIDGLFNQAPEGVKDAIFNARDEMGRPLKHLPNVLRFLTDMALQINPVSALINPNQGGHAATADDRINEIEGWMKTQDAKYWKDEKIQEEYRKLLEFRTRQAS